MSSTAYVPGQRASTADAEVVPADPQSSVQSVADRLEEIALELSIADEDSDVMRGINALRELESLTARIVAARRRREGSS